MTGRYIDFDAARAERADEPLVLRAYGETFELPGSMPASVLLDVVRWQEERGGDDDLTIADSLSILRRMLPEDLLASFLERADFSTDDLTDLVRLVAGAYSGEVGEAPAPNREERRRKATALSTRPRGSTAGTTSAPARKKAPASPGHKSSSSGR
jgi:hypothetical protein